MSISRFKEHPSSSFTRTSLKSLVVGIGLVAITSTSSAEDLFKVGDKVYTDQNLNARYKQQLYDISHQFYRGKTQIVDEMVLDLYLQQIADSKHKSVDDIREEMTKVSDPSEQELKKFYEENKKRIPYPYDQIKDKLTRFWQDTQKREKFEKILDQAKTSKSFGFVSLAQEPQAPKMEVNIAGKPSQGTGKVTIVEFADYKCPHCKEAFEIFNELTKKYRDQIKFVFVDYPIIADSYKISEGAFCALKGGKYWEYHHYAYEHQGQFKEPSEVAQAIKLDMTSFESCYSKREGKDVVEAGRKEGERLGVSGTPSIYINGFKYSDGLDKDSLDQALNDAIAGRKYSS